MQAVLWITILLFQPQSSSSPQFEACLDEYLCGTAEDVYICTRSVPGYRSKTHEPLPLWEEFTMLHPSDPSLLFHLALLKRHNRQPWHSTMEDSQLLALEQDNLEQVTLCGLLLLTDYIQTGQHKKAARQVELVTGQPHPQKIPAATRLQFENKHLLFLMDVMGDLEKAERILQEIEADSINAGIHFQFSWLLRKGLLAMRMGDYRQARTYWQKYTQLASENSNIRIEVNGNSNLLSLNHMILKPNQENMAAFRLQAQVAFDFAKAKGESDNLPRYMLARAEKSERSLTLTYEGLAKAHTENKATWVAQFQCLLASLLASTDPVAAKNFLEKARTNAVTAKFQWLASNNAIPELHTLWKILPKEGALKASLSLLVANEHLGKKEMGDFSKVMMRSAWTDIYYALAGKLLRNGAHQEVEQAFLVMERMRARGLLEHLFSTRIATKNDTSESGLATPAEPTSLYGEMEFASLNQIREQLQPDEAILSFQMGHEKNLYGEDAGGAWLYVISKADVKLYPLPNILELVPGLETYIGLFSGNPDPAVVSSASVEIYKRLLAPALNHLEPAIDRLILVPDGILHHFPFATLRASIEAPVLASRFQLQVAPSATLWLRWRQSETQPDLPALVFADPYLGLPEDESTGLRAWTPGRGLSQLPFALKEGKAVVKYLGTATTLVSGKAASESYLKQQSLDQWGLLHFAAHAVVDQQNPHKSAVVLAQVPDSEDGLLQPPEIAALNLTGKMVVLSTCQSASGLTLKGEGVMSLARAFMRAGAHTVVATLWPLEDNQAAQFFNMFYRSLAQGKSNGEALQTAQRSLINKGEPPNAWAGVVLMGDSSYIPFPNQRPPFGLKVPLLLIFAFVCLALMAWRILSRKGVSMLQSTHSHTDR